MHDAARKAAEAIGYVGAGTVEFLYDPASERFFFLEMNTRLQVEHPVTEAVFGVDLVELQLRVAEGRRAAWRGLVETTGPRDRGAALRRGPGRRLAAAERPADAVRRPRGLPSSPPPTSYGVRLDSGFESGSEVSTYYDAMLAKVIAWAPTRREAARMLAGALRRARLHGMVTNRDLLVRVLTDPSFLAGEVSTDFFERTSVVESSAPVEPAAHQLLAAAVALAERERLAQRVQVGIPVGLAQRGLAAAAHRPSRSVTTEHVVEWFGTRDGYASVDGDLLVLAASPEHVLLEAGGVEARFEVAVVGDAVAVDGRAGRCSCAPYPASSTRPTRSPAAACSRRCRARSSRWPSRTARPWARATRCWCSRR